MIDFQPLEWGRGAGEAAALGKSTREAGDPIGDEAIVQMHVLKTEERTISERTNAIADDGRKDNFRKDKCTC